MFIRFNPDGYTTKEGDKIHSCFSITENTGISVIGRKNETQWKHRLNTLKTTIQKWLDKIPTNPVTIEELYYDYKKPIL